MLVFNSNQKHAKKKKNPFRFYFPSTKVRKIIKSSNLKSEDAVIKRLGACYIIWKSFEKRSEIHKLFYVIWPYPWKFVLKK